MLVLDFQELAELHQGLRTVAQSRHPDAAWARERLRSGEPLTRFDALRIRAAEFEATPVVSRALAAAPEEEPPARVRIRMPVA